MTYRYLVVIEKTGSGYSAYSPDVPGCVATGKTPIAVERAMSEAIEFHIEGLKEAGEEVPSPSSRHAFAEVTPDKRVAQRSSQYHIQPAQSGWKVIRSGAARASKIYSRKDLAIRHGRALARKNRVRVVVHNRDGSLEELEVGKTK